MLISREKKKENIAEYMLYMLHIEDIVRSMHYEEDKIDSIIIENIKEDDGKKEEIRQWYYTIASELKSKEKRPINHCNEVEEVLVELSFLHNTLVNIVKDKGYITKYEKAQPAIQELIKKSNKEEINEVQACFNGLFGMLYLKMKKQTITEETQQAIESIKAVVTHLAKEYHKMKQEA